MSSRLQEVLKRAFSNHPLIANSLLYGTLCVGAEFSQQTLSRKLLQKGQNVPYDPHVITRFGILGVAVYPPIYYYWYRWLDNRFVGTSAKVITKKLLLDQFLLTPPLLALFYVAMSLMENKQDVLDECKRKLMPTFKTSCVFWLPVQAMNFLVIPPTFRVAFVGSCAFAWVNILCWYKRQE